MGADNAVRQTEFVFRRLVDALRIGGKEYSPYLWLWLLVPVLVLGLVYVGWMYARDSRTVGRGWATFLAVLRATVYLLLAVIFLLPAWQVWETTEARSKVILLLDVSGSMGTKDDMPTAAVPLEKLLSRQDKVITFLTDNQIAFLKNLQEKNPVTAYRFGSIVDEESRTLAPEANLPAEQWAEWLKPNPRREVPPELSEEDTAKLRKKLDLEALLVNGTNLTEAVLGVLNRESNSLLQGVVVVSDGRNTQFSTQGLEELRARSERAKVPVFTVAVGEARQPISISNLEVRAPTQARPDDKFPIRVDVDGEGLVGKEAKVTLEVTKPNGEKTTLQPILKPGEAAVFKPGEPPHAQVEFEIDKPEIEGAWSLIARIPREPREIFAAKEHVTEPTRVTVVKKPVRVLLFAGGPTHEYQFVRTLFIREMDQQRAEVSIYLQTARPEVVQDVPAERMLQRFPTALTAEDDPKETAESRYYNLARYDLIIAFDPDWTQLSSEQTSLLEKWVGTHAGGLVLIAGPVNTFQLTRRQGGDGERGGDLRPILDLYPVLLEDNRLQGLNEHSATEPWRLNFPGATADMEFLKLDDEAKDQMAGWEAFFGAQAPAGTGVRHGFYNFYPVREVKPNATVVATLTDPRARMSDGREQPFLVTMPYGGGKVVYISSGEMWRLRQYRELFHERFWTKMARYAGSGNLNRISRRGLLLVNSRHTANSYVRFEAQLFGRDLQPLPRTEKPLAKIKAPAGVTMPASVELHAKPGTEKNFGGWFEGRFLVTMPGAYELDLPIPGGPDVLSNKFTVKEANPEFDNPRPDFANLRQIASDAAGVMARVSDEVKAPLLQELQRTNRLPTADTVEEATTPRLYFDLKGAEMIPRCMVTSRKTSRSRGPMDDLWDQGFILGTGDPPLKISAALLVIVGLLSLEWLTRKLLKMA